MTTDSQGAAGHPARSPWSFQALTALLVIAFVLQNVFLSCLCSIGTAKMAFAVAFDALVAFRMLLAWLLKERNRGWVLYAVLTITSPLWIELVARIVIGPH